MATQSDPITLRSASLNYLWMHNRDWIQMAEADERRASFPSYGRMTQFLLIKRRRMMEKMS